MLAWIRANRLLSILLFVAISFFIYYFINAIRWMPYINSIDYGEGFVMNYAKLWADGEWNWNINTPPYLTMAYGVGFPILAYPFVKLFGAELWVGRSISIIATLITCFLLYLIVKELTGKRSYAILASLLPATQPAFRDWSVMARVDMPAVMFDMIGFYLAIKYRDSKHFYWCVIPFVLAVMVKQIAVTALLALLIYLVIYNRERLLVFIGLFVAGVAVLVTPLMIVTEGAYWKHVVLYMNGIENINVSLFSALFPAFLYPFVPLLALSLVCLRNHWRERKFTLVSIFFVVAFIVDAVASSKTGASCMYYYEAIFAGCLCASLALPYVSQAIKQGKLQLDLVAVLCSVMALWLIVNPVRYVKFPDQQYADAMDTARAIMSDSDRPVITENPALALDLGKGLYIEYFIFTNMSRLGYWDETNYVNDYKNQLFDYVLMRVSLDVRLNNMAKGQLDGHFSDTVLNQIEQNYSLIYESDSDCWLYDVFLYESNGKLKNDDREIVGLME